MEKIRVQKWLSILGIASRREAEAWIKEGRITINGNAPAQLGSKVDPSRDKLYDNGRLIEGKSPPKIYWMLNKPDQLLVSRKAQDQKSTIFNLPCLKDVPFMVSPVGRLDYRTEGLLLLSNDGDFIYRLTHPKFHVPRYYQVLLNRKLKMEDEQAIKSGITLSDGPTGPLSINYLRGVDLGKSQGSCYLIEVHEGRNRFVRRIFESFDYKIIRLIRVGYGELTLDLNLAPGKYRQLTASEIKSLKKL